jgi:GNAT superfamily N-acetyltransferase
VRRHIAVEVRDRTAADLPALVETLWRVHGGGYPASWPTSPTAWLTPQGLVRAVVAVVDGTVVGHAGLTVPAPGRMPELTRLFVDPTHRGAGVADALLDRIESTAPSTHVRLDVTEDTPAAWRLYERHGWRLTGRGPADWAKPSGEVPTLRYYAKRVG